jgi:hypothetical protein
MSARKALALSRAEFLSGVIDAAPCRSRARELVGSGLLDHAAQIAELAHGLTDSAIGAMEAEMAEPSSLGVADIRSLRSAAFKGIVYGIIDRLERGVGR